MHIAAARQRSACPPRDSRQIDALTAMACLSLSKAQEPVQHPV
jgi:hypothetical protein